jgi:hypothetical protein
MRSPLHLVTILVVVIAAACQGAATPTQPGGSLPALGSLKPSGVPSGGPATIGPQTSASVTARPTRTPGASGASKTAAASKTPAGSSGPTTPFHAATDLERVLPIQAGGLPLTVESVTGAGFADANGGHKVGLRCRWYQGRGLRCRDQALLASAVTALGKSVQDVAIAVAYNETENKEIEVQATRVAGVSGSQVLDATLAVLRDAAAKNKRTLNAAPGSLGGKSVTVITYSSPYPLGLRRYLYASGDLLFDIRRAYDAPAAEILQGLP